MVIVTCFILYACVILWLIAACFHLNSPKRIGKVGETRISDILSCLPSNSYHILNDILIKTNNFTAQIDHLVISIYGIFVIETKNYKGWITGAEDSYEWTQHIYNIKYKLYNPIKQNRSHINILKRILKLPEHYFIPIVSFTHRAKLKVHTQSHVVYTDELINTIKQYSSPLLYDLDRVTDTITNFITTNEEDIFNHNQRVKNTKLKKQLQRQERLQNRLCPECGSTLNIYNGHYGTFAGCSKYPECKYTKKF